MDGDEGVSLDVCKQISRILETILDEEPTLGGIYTLEVSSPGVSRSLRFPRQYLKHVGRTLEITLTDDQKIEGVLMTTGHESISLELKAKDKKSQPENREVKYDDIREAFVVIQFKKK
jgi:ribosome maturation factor RimP